MLEALKAEVLRVSRLAEENNLCKHGGGNFSQIDRDEGLFVITPHAESRFSIDSDAMIVMDLEGHVVENLKNLTPSSEWPLHTEILKNRKDVNAICHTHARNACTFSVLGKEIKPVVFEAAMYGGVCKVMPFQAPGTMDLARSAVEGLKGTEATILGHHGLVTVAQTIYEAYMKSIYVEEVGNACLQASYVVGYDNVEQIPLDQLFYLMNVMGLKA